MLWIKMFRDLKQNIVQFLTIFVMAFICLFVVAGMGVCQYDSIDRYLKESNFRDLEIQGDYFSPASIESLRYMDEIDAVDASFVMNGKLHLDTDIKMLVNYISSNDVSKMYVFEGTPYEPGMSGIWLDDSLCEAQNIQCGDIVTLTIGGKRITEEVKGRVWVPTYLYYVVDSSYVEPVYGEFGFAYMDASEYIDNQVPYNQLFVDLKAVKNQLYTSKKENAHVEYIKEKIKKRLDLDNLTFITKGQCMAIKPYIESIEASSAMGYVFPPLFGMIALLGIMTTMTRIVARQRTTIGSLKALGFTSNTITFHYISYSVVIVIVGCILGSVSGYYILGSVMLEDLKYYNQNPYLDMPVTSTIYVASGALVLAAILVGYLSNNKILSLSASQILQPEAPKQSKLSWYELLPIWKKLKFSLRWNIKDITNNAFRTIMSILGILLCSALVFASVGFFETLYRQVDWQYGELIKAQNRISFAEGTPYATVYDYANEYDGQMIQRNSIIMPGHETEILTMTVVDRGNNFFFHDEKGKYRNLPSSGVGISYKFSELSGIQVGDIVSWKIQGKKENYTDRVTFVYREPLYQGIVMSREWFEGMRGQFEPLEVYTNSSVPKDIEIREEIDGVNSRSRLMQSMRNVAESNYFVSEIMILTAIILGVSIQYNLCSMSYNEKVKDLVTLKVLGFRTKELKDILMQQNLVITGIGCILGVPVGFYVLDMLSTIMGDDIDCMVRIDIVPYIVEIIISFGMSILITKIISSKLEDIDMVELLKGI